MGVQNVFRLKYIYLAGDIAKKREVIGSIYPEKFEMENFAVRTAYANEIVRLIYMLDEGYSDPEKKNGSKKSSRSGLVALPGQFSNRFMHDLKLMARL